ncbi:MAG: glycoside hydrolase family 3 N-terminal domain-containing protein [Actinomycetota bacterium]
MTGHGTSARRVAHHLLMPGFSGTVAPMWLLDAARDGLAGVVLFAGNTPDLPTTAALTEQLYGAASGLLIAVDEEGGDVSRLQAAAGSYLPGAAALGTVDDVGLTYRCGLALGRVLVAAGIDLALAPVLDVNCRADNPVIGVRSFGATPELVSRHGVAFLGGLHAGGVAACGKHFPGHGDTAVDSHLTLPVLDADLSTLQERDLPPFVAAIDAGLDVLMTGHLRVPAIGQAPASLEPAVTALARKLGFAGPIMTDALDMAAVAADPGFGEACVRAVEAGADLLCLGTTAGRDDEDLFRIAHDALMTAVEQGRITSDRLREGADRLARLRTSIAARRMSPTAARSPDAPGPELAATLDDLERVGAEAAARAVHTLGDVRLRPGDLVLDLRRTADHAAGLRSTTLTRVLSEVCRVTVSRPPAGVTAEGLLGLAIPGPRLALVTREADPRVGALLKNRPDALVLHVGTAESAPVAGNLVLAHGVGLANAREVASRCSR